MLNRATVEILDEFHNDINDICVALDEARDRIEVLEEENEQI